ncbi:MULTISPECIES: maltose acetyltransferase domain-containing protein [Streptococcus]|uniref:Maltose acetyltransferase domain-containing protein n=1 Tax=Streptococcus caledonicus TaxID=2614158 RepID=A0ABW0UBU8_9STRE
MQHTGDLYLPNAPEILAQQLQCQELLYDFNHIRPSDGETRRNLLEQMFAKVGQNVYRDLSHQFNLPVTIGENCWLGANVTVLPGVTYHYRCRQPCN